MDNLDLSLHNLGSADEILREIRRLWKETGGDDLLPAASRNAELQAYYNATILNLLSELEELQDLSTAEADAEFLRQFTAARFLMFQQLRLLSNIGTVLLQ